MAFKSTSADELMGRLRRFSEETEMEYQDWRGERDKQSREEENLLRELYQEQADFQNKEMYSEIRSGRLDPGVEANLEAIWPAVSRKMTGAEKKQMVLDFSPGGSDYEAGKQMITGEATFSGDKLGGFERTLAGLSMLPVFGGVLEGAIKTAVKGVPKKLAKEAATTSFERADIANFWQSLTGSSDELLAPGTVSFGESLAGPRGRLIKNLQNPKDPGLPYRLGEFSVDEFQGKTADRAWHELLKGYRDVKTIEDVDKLRDLEALTSGRFGTDRPSYLFNEEVLPSIKGAPISTTAKDIIIASNEALSRSPGSLYSWKERDLRPDELGYFLPRQNIITVNPKISPGITSAHELGHSFMYENLSPADRLEALAITAGMSIDERIKRVPRLQAVNESLRRKGTPEKVIEAHSAQPNEILAEQFKAFILPEVTTKKDVRALISSSDYERRIDRLLPGYTEELMSGEIVHPGLREIFNKYLKK